MDLCTALMTTALSSLKAGDNLSTRLLMNTRPISLTLMDRRECFFCGIATVVVVGFVVVVG